MMSRSIIFLLLGVVCCFLVVLFIGIFYDRHTDGTFFVKYRPTSKYYFYPPQYYLEELSPKERRKERAYFQEFVIDKDLLKTNAASSWYPAMVVQSALTLLCIGGWSLVLKRKISYWQIPVHFILCLVPTELGMICIAFPFNLPLLVLLALVCNIMIPRLLMMRKNLFYSLRLVFTKSGKGKIH